MSTLFLSLNDKERTLLTEIDSAQVERCYFDEVFRVHGHLPVVFTSLQHVPSAATCLTQALNLT